MALKDRIADILLTERVLDAAGLTQAQERRRELGGTLITAVLQLGLAKEEPVLAAVAKGLRLERAAAEAARPDAQALSRVDVRLAEDRNVFPLQLTDGGRTLRLAMANPADLATIDELSRQTHARIVPLLTTERDIQRAITRHYHHQEPDDVAAGEVQPSDQAVIEHGPIFTARAFYDPFDPAPPPAAPRDTRWTPELRQRLATLQANQDKASRVMRAVRELLSEKSRR